MNILVVDDEEEIADLIELYLKNEEYNVFKFYESKDILKFLEQEKIDLALIDVMMEGIDGFSLCTMIREHYNFPIIMVTAKVSDMDKIEGLTMGADDYITKPFKPLELIARVKAQLRRYTKYNKDKEKEDIIEFGGLYINKDKHECFLNEKKIVLTPIEFSILWHLARNRGQVVKTEDLFKSVWKEKYYEASNNTIMVHIRHIRKKMGDSFDRPKYIKTVWGVGYKIEK